MKKILIKKDVFVKVKDKEVEVWECTDGKTFKIEDELEAGNHQRNVDLENNIKDIKKISAHFMELCDVEIIEGEWYYVEDKKQLDLLLEYKKDRNTNDGTDIYGNIKAVPQWIRIRKEYRHYPNNDIEIWTLDFVREEFDTFLNKFDDK